ncbi:MAG: hypothetical protein WC340_15595 [Kiritimatiellia bacterium]
MAQKSYTKDVLNAALKIAGENGGEATAVDISAEMFTQNRAQHKKVLNILGEHARAHRLTRIRQGVYGPAVPVVGQVEKREVMWNVLQMRRRVTVEDLMEMAAVSAVYAKEWLRMLVAAEIVKKHQMLGKVGVWMLVNAQAEMPENAKKARALRELRASKKRLLAGVADLEMAVSDVCQWITDLEES